MEKPPELFSSKKVGCPHPFLPSYPVLFPPLLLTTVHFWRNRSWPSVCCWKNRKKLTCYPETGLRFLPSVSRVLSGFILSLSWFIYSFWTISIHPSAPLKLPLCLFFLGFGNHDAKEHISSQFLLPAAPFADTYRSRSTPVSLPEPYWERALCFSPRVFPSLELLFWLWW